MVTLACAVVVINPSTPSVYALIRIRDFQAIPDAGPIFVGGDERLYRAVSRLVLAAFRRPSCRRLVRGVRGCRFGRACAVWRRGGGGARAPSERSGWRSVVKRFQLMGARHGEHGGAEHLSL